MQFGINRSINLFSCLILKLFNVNVIPRSSKCKNFNKFASNLSVYFIFIFLINTTDFIQHLDNTNILHNIFKPVKRFSAVNCIEKVCGEFVSDKLKSPKGKFEIESFLTKEEETSKLNDSLLCIYKFVANKNEKVLLNFLNFDIKSLAPDCIHEYVDIYIEATDETLNNYVETNFLSRWCGWKKPNILVSYHNTIVFAYHTDGTQRGSTFSGTYEFINADIYNNGKKSPNNCEYVFNSEVSETGTFLSPTYPGTYPNILDCTYKFIGQPNERISIHFEEILIHYGADHCPYDVIKLYDYQKVSDKDRSVKKSLEAEVKYDKNLIDFYCGRKLNFTVFSSYNMFEIEFEMSDSLGNEEYSEDENKIILRKGFKAFYTFSKNYADLSFITGTYIAGTNCDQRITSTKSTGLIYSPNYFRANSINASCKYIFEGLNDNYNLESIKLNFHLIDVKISSSKNICNENSVSHFVVYGSEKQKPKYCFNRLTKEPKEIRSIGSQMTLIFNSINVDQYTPSNFKASYSFYAEFGIEGTRVYPNRTCLYTYNSENVIHGHLNSPRYPQNYPLNIKCNYVFDISSKYERILFTFKDFKLSSSGNGQNCSKYEDSLSIYQTTDDLENLNLISLSSEKQNKQSWSLLNRFCGTTIPYPIISEENTKKLMVTFYSDNMHFATGFNLNYNYVRLPECKHKYLATENQSSGQIIITNDLEATYYCDWYIKASSEKSFLLSFKNQNLDDSKSNQFGIRVYDLNENTVDSKSKPQSQEQHHSTEMFEDKYSSLPKYEYTLDKSMKYFQIDSSHIKLQLVIGKSMIMNEGKLIINWITATKDKPCRENEFMCNQSRYCIKMSYYCDRVDHCPNDFSDEPDKCFVLNAKQSSIFLPYIQITSFVASLVVLVIFLSICLACRLKSIRKAQIKSNSPINGNGPPPMYYKYSPANSIDYLEAAITSV